MLAMQLLYHLSHSASSFFVCWVLLREGLSFVLLLFFGGREMGVQAGLQT
jgi:hypothetical protein